MTMNETDFWFYATWLMYGAGIAVGYMCRIIFEKN